MPPFSRVPPELDFPKEEREILAFWKAQRIFEKTLEKPAKHGPFVFYEGPPTANGVPHNGHVLTRVIKDLFPRYRTMRGYRVPRKAGWDTHGLPVEVEVEKELRIHGKAAIEQYGVEPFIQRCIQSVFRYTKEWEDITERVGFWVDLGQAYVTYHRSYVESVWWALSKLFEKGLLYQGHKVVWWWAQGGTALSSGEVGQGYKQVDDPSVYVAFQLKGEENLSLLVWTTTPWTLPSNMFAAVSPRLEYVIARNKDGRRFVVAKGLVEALGKKLGGLEVERDIPHLELVGREYAPPFDLYASKQTRLHPLKGPDVEPAYFRVVTGDFVTLDAGTGIVHIAPAFGEDDHELFAREQTRFAPLRGGPALELFCAVKPDGTFVDAFERYAGRWVKDCDKEVQHDLKDRGLLVHAEQYRHDYPFCWRADSDPLIQYARPAWYIRTSALKDKAIENSRQVQWIPGHLQGKKDDESQGRFGDFLANNVDWALSRERWWGTPLNVWICDKNPEHRIAPSGVAAIEARNPHAFDHFHKAKKADPGLSEHLIVHKPWIDQVTMPCDCGGTYRRVPEVIDCWFDSGCMPFAQWGYPHAAGSEAKLKESFPADFISEAIDQTRGWFYSLLMISTLVFDEPLPRPFKTCVVLGHISDKEGKKESKSKGNYTPPEIILDDVKMEFAVGDPARYGVAAENPETAVIGWEDLEGMDLGSGATVEVSSFAGRGRLVLNASKKLPRRVVILHEKARAELAVNPTSVKDVKPVEVPRLHEAERVTIRDTSSSAPGADAFRWFFYASSAPWLPTRHSLSNVRALQKEFAVKLRNVYSFFTIYANIDGFEPAKNPTPSPAPLVGRGVQGPSRDADKSASAPPPHEWGGGRGVGSTEGEPELDRWIRSEVASAVLDVTKRMDAYDVHGATGRLVDLVDALSNWWLRRSRARFWRSGWDDDKKSAYATLYGALVTITKLSAPFTPFGAEAMYQNLVARAGAAGAKESVHLEDWPEADEKAIDAPLGEKIALVRSLVSLGLQVRTDAKIKVRQPLRQAHVVLGAPGVIDDSAVEMLREELNVLSVAVYGRKEAARFVEYKLKPSFRSLGARGLGKEAQALKKAMATLSSEQAFDLVERLPGVFEGVELHPADVEVELSPREGFAAAGHRAVMVVLDTRLDDELRELGFVRELQSRVQAMRKDDKLEYTDRIRLSIAGSDRVQAVLGKHKDALAQEVLATSVEVGPGSAEGEGIEIEGERVWVRVERA